MTRNKIHNAIYIVLFLIFTSCSEDYNLDLGKNWFVTENNVAIFDRDLGQSDSLVWFGESKK